jgi:hypothetical protein
MKEYEYPSDDDTGTHARARRDDLEALSAYGVTTEALMSSPHLPEDSSEPITSSDELEVAITEEDQYAA